MLLALYSLPYRPKGFEVELRSKGLALSTPSKVPFSATRTGGFACEVGGKKVKIRSRRRWKVGGGRWKDLENRFMGFPFSLS